MQTEVKFINKHCMHFGFNQPRLNFTAPKEPCPTVSVQSFKNVGLIMKKLVHYDSLSYLKQVNTQFQQKSSSI